jgi:hypothetical protein
VIALYPAVLIVVGLLLARRHDEPGERGWRWFAAWSVAGALFTFSFLAGFSIGLFFLPLAAAALFFVATRAPGLPESVGFVAGIGLIALVIAVRSRDYVPCGPHGELSIPPGAPPGTKVSCGGFDPTPWFAAGLALLAVALLAYSITARLRRA